MKTKRRSRKRSKLSHLRWTSYAIAAGATAVAAMPRAEAEIHYSGLVNFKFQMDSGGYQTHSFPLSQGVVLVGYRYAGGNGNSSASFGIKGAAVSNALRAYPLSSISTFLAKALPRGSVVSQGYFGRFGSRERLQYYHCGFPGWQEPGTHAIGFRFNSGHGVQYGWVRIKWGGCLDDGTPHNKYIVKDYAWGDPGDQIRTGQTQLDEEKAKVAPQPAKKSISALSASSEGSLGLLAFGALGLMAWRKSRRVA